MARLVYAIIGVLIGAALTTCAVSRRAVPNLDAAKLAPEMYQVRVDNEHVRVIEYHLKPGEKEPMHSHPAGVAVYLFTDAKLRATSADGRVTENLVNAGTALWRDPVTHTAENIGTTEARALLVELKRTCN
jgi:quercetin dioxygenase-like cupin family protein